MVGFHRHESTCSFQNNCQVDDLDPTQCWPPNRSGFQKKKVTNVGLGRTTGEMGPQRSPKRFVFVWWNWLLIKKMV